MMSRFYRLLAIVLCACMLFSFAACGEDSPAQADDITPPAEDTPTADEPEEPSAEEPDTPTQPDIPTEPSEPSKPETPTEPDEPTEPEVPSEPDDPVEPDTPTEPEKWSSPEAQAMLEIYNEVLQGKRTLFNTYTKKEEYFADPENDPATILGRAQNRIIDFDQDGIPEVLVWFGSESSSMPYDVLYCIDGMIYCAPLQKRSISSTAYKGYIFVGSGGANTHYYSTYDLTKTGLSYTEIAKSDMKWDNITDQPLYYYELNGVEVTKEEFDAFLEWLTEN